MMWQPTANWDALKQRAVLIAKIRHFFAERNIVEVETPVLSHATVTDPFVVGIPAIFKAMGGSDEKIMYLQTSPEYAMKRLLAHGSGPIYQMSKAFRQGEISKIHNPEFTMLEWYRPGFDHHMLMDEMDLLLQCILQTKPAERMTYENIFRDYLNLDPHHATIKDLKRCAHEKDIHLNEELTSRDAWLDVLWTHYIEPRVAIERPLFLYDFPASQASLAKVRAEDPPVASRFEVYFKGVELANGFHELQNSIEQAERFAKDLAYRQQHHLPAIQMDQRLLAALNQGLPDCAGVALGVDRLIMLALDSKQISDVVSFTFANA